MGHIEVGLCYVSFSSGAPDVSCQWQRFPTNVSQNIVTFSSGGGGGEGEKGKNV
jgi:hypothetical protein